MKLKFSDLLRIDVLLFIFCSLIFVLYPQIDLIVSGWFFQNDAFFLKTDPVVQFFYLFFGDMKYILLPLLIALSIYFFKTIRATNKTRRHKKLIFTYLLCSLLLGPGLLVNTVLKNNSIGRARPVHIQEFGGEHQFTRAYEYAGVCKKNCSFVSGHASIGFFFIGLGCLLRSRRAFWLGFTIGAVAGVTRIIQGGHFLSDVVLAFWAVYWVNLWLAHTFKLDTPEVMTYTLPALPKVAVAK